jgi:Skp family chaperone for outer membrane proteins
MTTNTLLTAIGLLMTVASVSTFGQKPATPTTQQPAAARSTGPIPEGKIAFIFSDDFRDLKTGITRYGALMNTLNLEFQKPQKDIDDLALKIQQLQDELNKMSQSAVVDQRTIQAKSDQFDQWKKDYQRKSEDLQAAYKKRHDEIMTPLNVDIGKALEAYAKANGITVIIDGNRMPPIYLAENVDITRAFINDFNTRNPAPATATPRE